MYLLHKTTWTLHIQYAKQSRSHTYVRNHLEKHKTMYLSLEETHLMNERIQLCKPLVLKVCLKHADYPACLFEK